MRTTSTPIQSVLPDLSRLSRRERRGIRHYCSGKVFGDWRMWALTAAMMLPALALPFVTNVVLRLGGIWLVLASGAVGGLLMGAIIATALNRLSRPHLAAALYSLGLCPRCAYDLRGTPGLCPECGEVVAPRVSK